MKRVALLLLPVLAILLGSAWSMGGGRGGFPHDPRVINIGKSIGPLLPRPSASVAGDAYCSRMQMGWENLQKGLLDQAADQYSRAARMHDRAVDPRLGMLAVAIAAGGAAEVVLAGEEVLTRSPDHIQALRAVGAASLVLGDHAKAGRVFRQILDLHPGDAEALRGAGQAAEAGGHTAAAKAFYGQIPTHPQARG